MTESMILRNGVTEFCNGQQGSDQTAFGEIVMRSPGFEPGLSAWEADVLTKLDYDRLSFEDLRHYY